MKTICVASLFISLASALAAPSQTSAGSLPVAFTIVPAPSPHAVTRSDRAATVDPFVPRPKLQIMEVHDVFFGEDQGTQFIRWLEGGKRALIFRISFPANICKDDGPCMTPECQAKKWDPDTCRIHNTVLDDCVIEQNRLVNCPTRNFNGHDRPPGDTVGPYSYNESAQPIYSDGGKLMGFLFGTHNAPPPSGVEVWKVEPDGSNAVQDVAGTALTTHGCRKSPNETLMVCETARASGGVDIILTSTDGTQIGSILEANEYEHLLSAFWSPDSQFLVYFSEVGNKGKIIYQDVTDLQHLGDPAHHKVLSDEVPGFYCNFSRCGPLGLGHIGSDFATFSPLVGLQKHPKWLAVAVQKTLAHPTPEQEFKRVIHLIALDHPEVVKEIELPNDVGYPVFSPDGNSLAFLSIVSPDDPRTQLFVANIDTGRWKQVTFIAERNRQVYDPHWAQ